MLTCTSSSISALSSSYSAPSYSSAASVSSLSSRSVINWSKSSSSSSKSLASTICFIFGLSALTNRFSASFVAASCRSCASLMASSIIVMFTTFVVLLSLVRDKYAHEKFLSTIARVYCLISSICFLSASSSSNSSSNSAMLSSMV